MYKPVKVRAYPTPTQEYLLRQTLGSCRFVYNYFLGEKIRVYKEEEKSLSYTDTTKQLTELKKSEDYSWLKTPDAVALQQSLRNLNTAYQNFFKKRARFPKFKSRRKPTQSYKTIDIKIEGNRIKLPKVGWVKVKGLRKDISGEIKSATISMKSSGRFYISVLYEIPDTVKSNDGGVVGIDVGIKDFYTDSNGNSIANPRTLYKYQKKLSREQRRLSRKTKDSANYAKQRIRLARVHEKIANIRSDFLHKQSCALANENQVVSVEDLNIQGMMKNHRLAKAISDVSWSEFFRQLEYKTKEHGGVLVKIPTFYPSSQMCSNCGYKNPIVKDLSVRKWECPECHVVHDRDVNASLNILRKGLSILENSTVGHTGTGTSSDVQNACGDYVRPDDSLATVVEARIPCL